MFLKLTVAGHMTIYLTRAREHHFWVRPFPSAKLFRTCGIAQVVATLFAVYGIFMNPIGWKLAGLIWAYALVWFVFNDLVKVKVYHLITHRARRERQHLERIATPLHP